MKLIKDIKELKYKGFGNCDCVCRVRGYEDGKKKLAIITELEENNGTSVTNFMESLMIAIKRLWFPDTHWEDISWIEHYAFNDTWFSVVIDKNDEVMWDDIDKPEFVTDD